MYRRKRQDHPSSLSTSASTTTKTQQRNEYQHHYPNLKSSIYPPIHPPNSEIIFKAQYNNNDEISILDHLVVAFTSLFVVGAVVWVPFAYIQLWKKIQQIPDSEEEDTTSNNRNDHNRNSKNNHNNNDNDNDKNKSIYSSSLSENIDPSSNGSNTILNPKQKLRYYYHKTKKLMLRILLHHPKRKQIFKSLLISTTLLLLYGPYRNYTFGKRIRIKHWRIWNAWTRFVGLEIVKELSTTPTSTNADNSCTLQDTNTSILPSSQAIYAVIPHGIFPFALGFSALPQSVVDVLGEFRPVVASATKLFPILRSIIQWIGGVDASKSCVHKALSDGYSIGLSPGGISEMFEGYPKPNRHPDDECIILQTRKGFLKMAIQHNIPVIPIYCFGGSKLFKRLQLPYFLERLSTLLRVSICVFFGQFGLPIPYRRRLMYAVGSPIFPTSSCSSMDENSVEFQSQVDTMHKRFCEELTKLFDKHKTTYGWDHKRLLIC